MASDFGYQDLAAIVGRNAGIIQEVRIGFSGPAMTTIIAAVVGRRVWLERLQINVSGNALIRIAEVAGVDLYGTAAIPAFVGNVPSHTIERIWTTVDGRGMLVESFSANDFVGHAIFRYV